MAPIVSSIEIARPPDQVFSYVADPSRLAEWQESVVSARLEDGGPTVGSRAVTTRRVGRMERTMTMELTDLSPPRSWAVRGIDGPVRGIVNATIDPLEDGARSRVTIELDFEGHGLGKLLVPLVVRRQAQSEMPRGCFSPGEPRPDQRSRAAASDSPRRGPKRARRSGRSRHAAD